MHTFELGVCYEAQLMVLTINFVRATQSCVCGLPRFYVMTIPHAFNPL